MNIHPNYFYSKNDEWVSVEGNKATIGISDYAQDSLSDIVFVEISVSAGDSLAAEDNIGTIESVKAASDIYTPVAGTVTEINNKVIDSPELLNRDPFGEAWLIKLSSDTGFDTSHLMDADAYRKYCEDRG
ncbi:MAG TPA: glycine cleavage system protein GcvH [Flexilinea sp.]|jgi:glycine cleavage system H protein|nr:glycine cleavage system protein GcvH [Flexilinea sp.]HOR56604.1 glycine cleavage system protein GcvH [Flexilinea sp.]HOU19513.1 glycine cleavage system protein GcvH [Flexilinea sp.]HPJ65813.1 glycine cleavage system protein GcvH [Flexilinea sp.]HPR71681.1 glycine cleavage system protein GcvH [Flexilinea sp.]